MASYIEQSADYWIASDDGYGNALIIRSSWSDRYLDIVARYKIGVIRLNEHIGWTDSDISFLTEIPGIHGVDILSDKVSDVSPVFKLKKLKALSLYCKAKVAGDFTDLENLKSISLGWRNAYESVFGVHDLARINITGFPEKDLTRWKPNEALKDLLLESKRLERLTGIERFPNINHLHLYNCRKLESLEAIASSISIQELRISRCPAILDISAVAHLAELRKLEIEDCRDIKSLDPVAECKKLKRLQIAGNTTVLDGDFTPLTKLPNLKEVLLAKRKHYSHTAEELEKH